MACLQRLIISRGLPRARLKDALEAFNACTHLGLEIQLKILQALPSLLQNYADELKGDLLSDALEVCSSLQSAKAQTVSGVAAATLQQLVTSIFEKVVNEDRHAADDPALDEVHTEDRPIKLKPAAFDAYRVFLDLALSAEERKTKYVQFASLPQESILELIWSCINTNPQLFASHPELGSIIRSNLLPLVTRALSEKLSFPVTLRSFRILDLLLGRCIASHPEDCVLTIGLITHTLDPDAAPSWKRALAMEILRNFFADGSHVINAYSAYDMAEGGKPVVQDLMSTFVRLSSEKPSVIGLGQQSTVPTGPASNREQSNEQNPVEGAGGMAGIISSALGVAEANVAGVSSRWSIPRTPCLEQLDKSEPPPVPETYIYVLVLECMSNLSDGLAKVILPLTVQHEKSKAKSPDGQPVANGQATEGRQTLGRTRSQSFLQRTVPLNPLDPGNSEVPERVRVVNTLVESCWPAVLATSSTFLNAALDDQYYRNLIKAYQRFAQVAGLMRLSTARDALMTTLGKAAIPPHIVNSALADPAKTPAAESSRVFSNPKSLLSVDTLVSQASALTGDRDRNRPSEPLKPMLTTRNLLCLRALLNLAIALGPTLSTAFAVVVDTLRQADLVLSATTPQQMIRQGLAASQKDFESQTVVQTFSNEVAAVEAAASRLLESTADYPNDAFLDVITTFCRVLHGKDANAAPSPRTEQTSPPPTPTLISRTFSGLTGLSALAEMQMRNYKFVIPRLGNLAELNVSRFVSGNPVETGWNLLIDELLVLASNDSTPVEARRAATGVLCKVAAETIAEVMEDEVEARITIQRRTLAVLLRLVDCIYAGDGDVTSSDTDVQGYVLDALQAILERCGESLVAGWNRTIAILSSVFERRGSPPDRQHDEGLHMDWENVSGELVATQLGRTAFAAAQLICSDFLSALPTGVMPSLIELLHRFATQTDDLNISLSTITMAWNVSDFLLGATSDKELDETVRQVKEGESFEAAVQAAVWESTPAQWLLLLLRLRSIVSSSQKEVRKAAFQTVCSIFKNNGTKLTAATWDLILRSIIFKIALNDVFLYHKSGGDDDKKGDQVIPSDENMSTAIISGMPEIMAQHLQLIEQVAQLPSLWEALLSRLEAYIDVEKHLINAAVYRALSRVLSQISINSRIWTGPMYRTLALWLKRNPATVEPDGKESNQDSLVAYIDTGSELYRLTQQSMSMSQTRTLLENLYVSIRNSDGPSYGADINNLSPLQAKAFELLKTVRSDSPSTRIIVASKLTTMSHDIAEKASRNDGPTFIAVTSEAIDWVQTLVLSNIGDEDMIETGVIVSVLENLRRLIEQKYLYNLEHRGLPLWRKATTTAIALASPVLQQCETLRLDRDVKILIWTEFVKIASGIVMANGLELVSDHNQVYQDETADLESFKTLQTVLMPRLGDVGLPDTVRSTYTRALFEASIIHPTEIGEVPSSEISPLENIGKIRRGRVKPVPYSPRERMCYECFSKLIDLSGRADGSAERKKLAQAAVPFLILRLAIPIRAYIADQPLRGRKPQPLSQLEELLFCLEGINKLECDPDALSANPTTAGQMGDRAHLHYLYPLLVKAVSTAGDRWSGADEVLQPLQRVLETILPMP